MGQHLIKSKRAAKIFKYFSITKLLHIMNYKIYVICSCYKTFYKQ